MPKLTMLLKEFHEATNLDISIFQPTTKKLQMVFAKPLAQLPNKQFLIQIQPKENEIQLFQKKHNTIKGCFSWKNLYIVAWSDNTSVVGQANYDHQMPLIEIKRFKHLMFCLYWMLYHEQPRFSQNVTQIKVGATVGLSRSLTKQKPTLAGYQAEQKIMSDVQEGKLKQYNQDFRSFSVTGIFGHFSVSLLRSKKDIAIAATTLYTRAAIKGGLPLEEAYRMSDDIIKGIEAEQQISNLYEYTRTIGEIFINRLNRQHLVSTFPLIYRAQQFINSNLTSRITIQAIADSLNVSKSHLEHEFKKETKQTIKSYIDQQLIKLAKELLTFSDLSISELANYLGFSSSSQFSQVFKRVAQMAPSQYRHQLYS